MANSKRKCGGCGEYFKPQQQFPGPVTWCSPKCGLIVAQKRIPAQRRKQEKQERAEIRKRKEAIKPRSKWLREAQAAFNAYIRERDNELPCISCGTRMNNDGLTTGSRIDAGHYRSTGSSPELRFEPLNCHAQCVKCNRHLSGSAVDYRIGLINKIGAEKVEWLEGPHEPKRYTVEDLKQIKEKYKRKLKELKQGRAA